MTTATRTQTVSTRVREALNAEGYTTTEAAKKIGVSTAQMSRLLNGKCDFKFVHLAKVGKFLGINPTAFLGLEITPEDNFLTIGEAAAMARRHPETIRKSVRSGCLQSTQRARGGWHLIRQADLTMWMAGAR